jgi:hypothetical protein
MGILKRKHWAALARGAAALALLASAAGVQPVLAETQGDTFDWTGEGDNDTWTDPCNWYPPDACGEDYPGNDDDDDVANLGVLAIHVNGAGSITLKDLNLAEGAQLLSGDIEVTGEFNWTDGTVGAKITIADGALMELSNDDGRHDLTDYPGPGQIDIHGSANVLDEVTVNFLGDTVWNNHGTLNLDGGTELLGGSCCISPTSNLNNFGSVVLLDPLLPFIPHEVLVSGLSVVQHGTIQVPSGITLTLGHGNHELRGGSTLTGDGHAVIGEFTSGNPVVTGTVEIETGTTLELRANDLGGVGTLTGGGTFHWTGGEIVGELTVDTGTTTRLSGPDDKRLVRSSGVGGMLTTKGPVTWEAGGRVFFLGAAIFNNHGQFNGGSAPVFAAGSCCQPPVSTFNNFGTFHVTSATTTFQGVFVRNQGTFSMTQGTMNFAIGATYSQTAGTTLLDRAAITATTGLYVQGGKLEGTGVITGPVHNHAEVRPGLPIGILKVAGSYTQYPSGRLFIEVANEGAGLGFDQLQVTGQAALTGTLNAAMLWPYEPEVGLKFPVVLFGTRMGEIGAYEGMELPKSRFFKPKYNPSDLTLEVWGRTFVPMVVK